jgi:hypothetical protein
MNSLSEYVFSKCPDQLSRSMSPPDAVQYEKSDSAPYRVPIKASIDCSVKTYHSVYPKDFAICLQTVVHDLR